MQRITITLTDEIVEELDRFMAASGAVNRSEAIRDLIRRALLARPDAPGAAPCLGVMSFTLEHASRGLGPRMMQRRLDGHDQTLGALSLPLDHSTSLEIEVLRGSVASLSALAQGVFLERGVAHGALALVPVAEGGPLHSHAPQLATPRPEGPAQAQPFGHSQPFGQVHSHPHPHPHPHGHPHPHPHAALPGPAGALNPGASAPHSHLTVKASFAPETEE